MNALAVNGTSPGFLLFSCSCPWGSDVSASCNETTVSIVDHSLIAVSTWQIGLPQTMRDVLLQLKSPDDCNCFSATCCLHSGAVMVGTYATPNRKITDNSPNQSEEEVVLVFLIVAFLNAVRCGFLCWRYGHHW